MFYETIDRLSASIDTHSGDEMNAFLYSNPLPWLLQTDSPAVKYAVLRDIPGNGDMLEYNSLFNDPLVRNIPGLLSGPVMGDTVQFDMPGRGTLWFFTLAVELGLDRRTPSIEKTAEYIVQKCQEPDGGIFLNWRPSLSVACRTGDIVSALIRAGFSGDEVKRGIGWILKTQREDGGWLHCPQEGLTDSLKLLLFRRAGKGLRREGNIKYPSCVHATCSCMRALLDLKEKDAPVKKAIALGAEFLLSHSLFISKKTYRSFGFPVFFRYDILQGLLLVSRAGMIQDGRTGEAFNYFMSCQNPDGTWNLESDRYAPGKGPLWTKGCRNKWITLNALRLLSYVPEPQSR